MKIEFQFIAYHRFFKNHLAFEIEMNHPLETRKKSIKSQLKDLNKTVKASRTVSKCDDEAEQWYIFILIYILIKI